MFASLFNSENPFWQGVAKIADLVWLNILFLISALPIVTAGAAFTALHDTAWQLHEERGGTTARIFWTSFRDNFRRATLIWLVAGPMGLAVLVAWLMTPIDELLVLKAILTLLYLLVFPYFFYLQVRFENTPGGTLRNAFIIPLSRLPYSAGVLGVTLVLVAVFVATDIYMPYFLPPLVMGGFGLSTYATVPLLNRSVAPWTKTSE